MSQNKNSGKKGLKRSLSLSMLIFYGVGTILGLGIYILLGKVAGEAGMLAPFAFLVSAVLATFTALSYGELSARIPKSAGEVNYVHEAFGKDFLSITVGWLICISAIISTATVVNGYVGYVQVLVDIPDWAVISGMVIVLGGIAVWGISESAYTIVIITIIEISGLFLVIFLAAENLAALPDRWPELLPEWTFPDWKPVLLGAFLAFFAFIGFEDMVNVAEEAQNPKRDMPKGILISLVIITVLYLVVATIASLGLTPEELNQSEAPLADILAEKGKNYPQIISAIGLVAIINGVLVQIVMIARVFYGMAEKNMAPALFGKINFKTRTPIWSTIISSGIILTLALMFELKDLAEATNYILLTVFILVNLSLWVLKKRKPHPEGIKKLPLIIPILGFFFSLGILLFQVYDVLLV